jgi:alpha 1,2-mannosyltransferase
MLLTRRFSRLLLATVVILGTIYIGSDLSGDRFSQILPIQSADAGNDNNNASDASKDSVPVNLDNLHRLPNADSFLPYFDRIREIPGLNVAQAAETCNWGLSYPSINFQYDEKEDWVQTLRSEEEITTRRQDWHRFLQNDLIPWDTVSSRFNGRGLVILAGNQVSLKRVGVILRLLTGLQSTIEIEIHHWGPEEINEDQKAGLERLWPGRLYFNDLSDASRNIFQTNHDQFYVNYQMKSAAILNSRFMEPFMLDSDNTPWLRPETLYDSETYREYGTVFWPDLARTRPQNPMWAITSTTCRMDEWEQESGQVIIDKRRYWYHMQLAAWFNAQEYYNGFLLGDKDMFRFAWHALKTSYGKPTHWLGSVGIEQLKPDSVQSELSIAAEVDESQGALQPPTKRQLFPAHEEHMVENQEELANSSPYFCGHSFAQHHPDTSEIAFIHGGLLKTWDKNVIRWGRATGGIFRHIKHGLHDTDPSYTEEVGLKWDGGEYVGWGTTNGGHSWEKPTEVGWCSDMAASSATLLGAEFEELFAEAGGYWMIDDAGD